MPSNVGLGRDPEPEEPEWTFVCIAGLHAIPLFCLAVGTLQSDLLCHTLLLDTHCLSPEVISSVVLSLPDRWNSYFLGPGLRICGSMHIARSVEVLIATATLDSAARGNTPLSFRHEGHWPALQKVGETPFRFREAEEVSNEAPQMATSAFRRCLGYCQNGRIRERFSSVECNSGRGGAAIWEDCAICCYNPLLSSQSIIFLGGCLRPFSYWIIAAWDRPNSRPSCAAVSFSFFLARLILVPKDPFRRSQPAE